MLKFLELIIFFVAILCIRTEASKQATLLIDTASLLSSGFTQIDPKTDSLFKEELIEASTKYQQFIPKRSMFLNTTKIWEAWKNAAGSKVHGKAGSPKRPLFFAAFDYFLISFGPTFKARSGNASFVFVDGQGMTIESFNGEQCKSKCHVKMSYR